MIQGNLFLAGLIVLRVLVFEKMMKYVVSGVGLKLPLAANADPFCDIRKRARLPDCSNPTARLLPIYRPFQPNLFTYVKKLATTLVFFLLRVPFNLLPQTINRAAQTYVSLLRINRFMNADELDPDTVTHDETERDPLVVENATFSWDEQGDPTLRNIDLRVRSNGI
jgi:hypothetical protein